MTGEPIPSYHNPHITEIQRAVCEQYGLWQADLTSDRRAREVARPRQLAMYLCKALTCQSLPAIGHRFGGRDHTTVIHAVKVIERLSVDHEDICEAIRACAGRVAELVAQRVTADAPVMAVAA